MVDRIKSYWRSLHIFDGEMLRGSAIAFVLKLCAAILSFASSVVIARLYGAEAAGLYFLSLTAITIASTLSRVGLDNTLVKVIAAHAVNSDWPKIKGAVYGALRIVLVTVVLTFLFVIVTSEFVAQTIFNKPAMTPIYRAMSFAILFWPLSIILAESLRGLKKLVGYIVSTTILIPAIVISTNLVFAAQATVVSAAYFYAFATFCSLLCVVIFWARTRRFDGLVNKAIIDYSELQRSSWPLFIQTIFQLVNAWTCTIMLGVFAEASDVALFGAANRAAVLISFILIAVNAIAGPRFSELYASNNIEGLQKASQFSSVLLVAFSFPLLLLSIFFPLQIMGLYGDEFVVGASFFVILALGQFINVATGSVGYLLIMSGNERILRNNVAASSLVVILFALVLIPTYGALGAAIASAIGLVTINLISLFAVKRLLAIKVTAFGF